MRTERWGRTGRAPDQKSELRTPFQQMLPSQELLCPVPAPVVCPPRPPHWLWARGAALHRPPRPPVQPGPILTDAERRRFRSGRWRRASTMPRSFLVKKHFSASKKPNYSELESQTGACRAEPSRGCGLPFLSLLQRSGALPFRAAVGFLVRFSVTARSVPRGGRRSGAAA